MTAKPGKYMWLERDYNDDDEEDDQKADGAEGSGKGKEKEGEVKEEEKEPEIIAAPETKVRLVLSSILVSSHTPLSPKLTFSHFFLSSNSSYIIVDLLAPKLWLDFIDWWNGCPSGSHPIHFQHWLYQRPSC